jgi:hypothetical protein
MGAAATARTRTAKARKTEPTGSKRRRVKPGELKSRPPQPADVCEQLQKLTGSNRFKITFEPGLYAGREGDGGHLLLGRFIERDDDEFPSDRNVFVDLSQPAPRRQLIAELRRVASVWSTLADRVERPKGTPPLTYAVISVPDGEIHSRGHSREQADMVAFIWNQDLEHHKRAAVIPDADLRHLQVATGDLALADDERFKHDWPTYPVGVYDNSRLLRIEQLPDPRIAWCRSFNEAHKGLQEHAVPLFVFADETNDAAFLDDEEGGVA